MKVRISIRPCCRKYFVFLLLLFSNAACGAQEFYVSPSGSDTYPGTREKPFKTFSHARDEVRKWNEHTAGNEDITVWFYGGEYRLTRTLVFGIHDSAKPGQTITYCAMPGEKPVISSDLVITGWKKNGRKLKGLPKAARGKIWVASVPSSITSFNVLFNGKGMLPRARTGAIAHLRKSKGWNGPAAFHTSIPFHKEWVDSLFHPLQAEIAVIGAAPWNMNILPVKSVDTATGTVYLGRPSTYALAQPLFGFGPKTIWVENTFSGLRHPGNWVFDQQKRLLYLWPQNNKVPGKDIVIPGLIELVRVAGETDYNGPTDIPVRGLTFKGITFNHGDRYESCGQTGLGLQHDWNRFDAATALLRFRGAKDCTVEDCHFINSGGDAIRFDLYAENNKVLNNEISDIGGTGILLAGYGPGIKDVNRNNEISNNYIHHIGIIWWHSMAIWAWQSGHNIISHNAIDHIPYTAIAVTGRIQWDTTGKKECSRTIRWSEVGAFNGKGPWEVREKFLHGRDNIIEQNDISYIMEKMQDGDGIYISGAGRGNLITGNFIHNTPSHAWGEGIRCDDDQNETLIENNIIYKFGCSGTGICSKGRNYIFNNIIACPLYHVRRGMLSLEPTKCIHIAGSRILRNIFYATQPGQRFVFQKDISRCIRCMQTDYNTYFNSSDPKAADGYLAWARKNGNEINSIQEDPLFVNIKEGNFQLRKHSPAKESGFKTIDRESGIIKKAR